MGTVTIVTRTYPDVPVSALRHMTGMTVHAVDLEGKGAPSLVSGTLARIAASCRVGITYLGLASAAGNDVATVRDTDHVTVTETVRLCDEHGLDRCDCDAIAAELAGQH